MAKDKDEKELVDSIVLGSSNALIMGHTSDKVSLSAISQHHIEKPPEVLQNGLFDASTPNYHTYYPDTTAADFIPQEGDFYQPTVRALSQVVVHKEWNPVDFGQGNVLQDAASLLRAQTIYVDHETSTGNSLGSVYEVFWEQKYKSKEGLWVPAGINAKLKIDGKSHPNIVRKMAMDPPAIHSLSVTVLFAWEPSHKGIPSEEFYRNLGSFDKDGKMYTRVATKIKAFKEISLVGHGADPYAQIIRDGQITNPRYADIIYNDANGKPKGVKYYGLDFREDLVKNSEEPTIPEPISNNETSQQPFMKKEFLLLMAAAMAITTEGKDEAALTAEIEPKIPAFISGHQTQVTELADAKTTITEKETALTEAATKINDLTTQLGKAPESIALAEKATTALRTETIRLAKLAGSDKTDATLLPLLESANYDTLTVLRNQYASLAETKYPAKCGKCGSTEVSRSTAQLEEAANPGEDAPQKLSLRERREAKQMESANKMHG